MSIETLRPLTTKEHGYVDSRISGHSKRESAKRNYNVTSTKSADVMAQAVESRPSVKTELERRIHAQGIHADKHLDNIDKLAMKSGKDDIRLRASQDLLDRMGVHHKYFTEEGKPKLEIHISDEEFKAIIKDFITE